MILMQSQEKNIIGWITEAEKMFCHLNGNYFPFNCLNGFWKQYGSSESNNFDTWKKIQMVNILPLAEMQVLILKQKSSVYKIPKMSVYFIQKTHFLPKKVILFIWL